MRLNLIVFLIFFFQLSTVLADGACDSLSELDSLQLGKTKLVACGSSEGNQLAAVKIIQVGQDGEPPVFEGDEAFKNYRLQKKSNSFLIQESLSSGSFDPFIEIELTCKNNKCKAKDSKCLWKKTKLNRSQIEDIKLKIKKKSCEKLDNQASEMFTATLNGSKEARNWFEADLQSCGDAGGSEAIETFKSDIKRLRKLKCF